MGSHLNENFSGEVRVALGVGDDTISNGFTDVDVELNDVTYLILTDRGERRWFSSDCRFHVIG